jgi:hypothetical protein
MHHPALPIASILIGAIVLLFGRRLFWLFVAAVGFWLGFELTPHLMQNPPPWLALAIAIALGLLGAMLAFVLQKVAIAVAGFLVGGHVALSLLAAFVTTHASYSGIAFVLGGILGAILLLVLFDWALIVFSAIAGAELIVSNLHIPTTGASILLLGLTIFGIIVQAAMLRPGRRSRL